MSTRRHLLALLGCGACLGALPAVASAAAITVQHGQGSTRLPAVPRRPVVFDLGALDILQALGVDVVGVPQVAYPAYLDVLAQRLPPVGSLFEPDYDRLAALRPDLILIAARTTAKYDVLSRLAPTIDLSTSTQGFVASVAHHILLLGRVFGREARAAEVTERMLHDVRTLQSQGAKAGRGLVLFVAGGNITPHVDSMRFGVVYEVTGIAPALHAQDMPPPVPRAVRAGESGVSADEAAAQERRAKALQDERLAHILQRHDPDWLLVLDRSTATGGAPIAQGVLAASAAVTQTTAWRKRQVVMLDAPDWYLVGGGPTALQRAATQIGGVLSAAQSAGQGL